jgi:hypothetical protein
VDKRVAREKGKPITMLVSISMLPRSGYNDIDMK